MNETATAEPRPVKAPTLKQLEAREAKLEGKVDKLIKDLTIANDELEAARAAVRAAKPSNGTHG